MGCRNRDFFSEDDTSSSSSSSSASLSEALLFATMCIVGLPVDVHVKDGSVYSGIFHTASVDGDYGIVLKKARMTKKGKGSTNVGKGGLIDTLVILSGDLAQVVAKGVMLPANGVGGNITGDDEEAVVQTAYCSESLTREVEKNTGSLMDEKQVNQSRFPVQTDNGFAHGFPSTIAENEKLPVYQLRSSLEVDCGKTDKTNLAKVMYKCEPVCVHYQRVKETAGPSIEATSGSSINERQAGDDKSKGKADDCERKFDFVKEKIAEKIQGLSSSHEIDTCPVQVEAVEHGRTYMTSNPSVNGLFCNNASASVKPDNCCCERSISEDSASTNTTQVVDLVPESHNLPAKSAPKSAESTRNAKEFKLNPAAKIFSPSFVNPISATAAVPTAATMAYIPNSSPMIPVTAIQPEVGFSAFASRPSVPVKVAQYSNLTVGNGGSGSQFSQPIVGQLTHRTQPLRYAAHYTPVLSEPAYLQPSSPAVMVGRSGQFVYVHPVSHDLVHSATAISARPLLNHAQFPKQQGGTVGQAMQICVPPPVQTSGQQPFALQSHIPLLQPGFPAVRPIPVPGPNGFYGTKFS